jgi:Bacterial Ig-like domain (group 1)/WD40-like Beta Propeller Repeat
VNACADQLPADRAVAIPDTTEPGGDDLNGRAAAGTFAFSCHSNPTGLIRSASLATLLLAALSACVDDAGLGPRAAHPGGQVRLAVQARVSGLSAQGDFSVGVEVTYQPPTGTAQPLAVNPTSFDISGGAPPPQPVTIDLSGCPTAGSTGCALSLTLTLNDGGTELARRTADLGLVHAGEEVSAEPIELSPSFSLIITGSGTGSGLVSVPAASHQPPLSCQITDGEAAPSGCAGRYPLHTAVTLTASEGLAAWTNDCASAGTGSTCELTMDGPRTAGASFTVPPTTGVLIVEVTGLPAGSPAQVTVSNSRGYSQPVSQTDTLVDLDPGTDYLVTAVSVPVPSEGRTYTPGPPSQPVSIGAGDTALAQVGYNPPESGSLAITVGGLPGDLPASVTVRGPSPGLPVALPGGQTLPGLNPGLYQIDAAAVGANHPPYGPYAATPASQEVGVASGQTTPASVTYAATRGALTVAISGLPVPGAARVTVTGPQGFSRSLNTTTTLPQLVPGSYTVAADIVPLSGHTYAPDNPSQVLEVRFGEAASVSVGYSALPPTTLERVKGDGASCQVNSFCEDLFEVRATDAAGNVVAGATVRWTAGDPTTGCPSGSHTDVSTGAAGIARASNQCKYPTPGTYHQTAALVIAGQVLASSEVTFTFTLTTAPVSAERSTVQLSSAELLTCCDTATVTVTALDANGIPVEGAPVVLATDGSVATPIQPVLLTDANGRTTGEVVAKAIGSTSVSASVGTTTIAQAPALQVIAGIVFQSVGDGSSPIAVVRPTGGTPSLPALPEGATEPAWSPDGSKLAMTLFNCESDPCERDIYVSEANGAGAVNVTRGRVPTGRNKFGPAWSPEGDRIAFTVDVCNDACLHVEVLDLVRGDAVDLTPEARARDPAWSPDGDRIAFAGSVCTQSCQEAIYAVDARTPSAITMLSPALQGASSSPAWSTDGQIVFSFLPCFSDCNSILLTFSAATGSDTVNITPRLGANATSPTWSPDGSRIAFTAGDCDEGCRPTIVVSDRSGNLLDGLARGRDPSWR